MDTIAVNVYYIDETDTICLALGDTQAYIPRPEFYKWARLIYSALNRMSIRDELDSFMSKACLMAEVRSILSKE